MNMERAKYKRKKKRYNERNDKTTNQDPRHIT